MGFNLLSFEIHSYKKKDCFLCRFMLYCSPIKKNNPRSRYKLQCGKPKNNPSKRSTRSITLAILILMALSASLASAQGPISPNPIFGAVESYDAPDAATLAGVGWTRVQLRWAELQPNGPADWNPFFFPDSVLERELADGREVVGLLINTATWAVSEPIAANGFATPPEGLYLPYDDPGNLWANFVRMMVTRYKGRINHWIIWNEPDLAHYDDPGLVWAGSVKDYYQLLKVAYLTAKEIDPACKIHVTGTSYWWDHKYGREQWIKRFFDVVAADPEAPAHDYYFDAVTTHIYFKINTIWDIIQFIKTSMNAHGIDKPIWLAETNAPPSNDPAAIPAEVSFEITQEEQAAFIIQASALALAAGAERIEIYKMVDKSTDADTDPEPFGMVRQDGSYRPAFHAFQVTTRYFRDVRRAARDVWGETAQVTLNEGNRTATVLWNRVGETRTVRLAAIAPQATLVEQSGQARAIAPQNGYYTLVLDPASAWDPHNGGYMIGGPPLVIVENGPVSARGSQRPPTPAPTATANNISPPQETRQAAVWATLLATPTAWVTRTTRATRIATPTTTPTYTATPTARPTQTIAPTITPTQTATPTARPTQTVAPTTTPSVQPIQPIAPTVTPTGDAIWAALGIGLALAGLRAGLRQRRKTQKV